MTEGVVLWGSNNIFHVDVPGEPSAAGGAPLAVVDGLPQAVECRIKGKQLAGTRRGYNVLAPGDRVGLTLHGSTGQIEKRLPRKNEFIRWNRKRNAVQTIAANLDLLIVVSSPREPAFRPRFIDRAMVAAELEEIPFALVINKSDQGIDTTIRSRLELLENLGYPVLSTSALEGGGIGELEELCRGREVAFLGQSGVGKSSLLNALEPEIAARIGAVSSKYNRGRHTTTLAVRLFLPRLDCGVIDTPGIRELDLYAFRREQIAWGFREMAPLIPECRIPGCTHLHEPDCAVRAGVEAGRIDIERYESYRRIIADHQMSGKLAGEDRYAPGR